MIVINIYTCDIGTQIIVHLNEPSIRQSIGPGNPRYDAAAKRLAHDHNIKGTFVGVDFNGFEAQFSWKNEVHQS